MNNDLPIWESLLSLLAGGGGMHVVSYGRHQFQKPTYLGKKLINRNVGRAGGTISGQETSLFGYGNLCITDGESNKHMYLYCEGSFSPQRYNTHAHPKKSYMVAPGCMTNLEV